MIEIVGVALLSEVMFGRAMNRTTTNGCLIVLDYYLLGGSESRIITDLSDFADSRVFCVFCISNDILM